MSEAFYHGTRAAYGRGGYLFPRSWHGGAATTAPVATGREPAPDAADWVYVTTSLTVAWVYAWCAPGRGKPKVLVVRPSGTLEPDPEHSPRMEAYRCESARVLSILREPVMTGEEARSGWILR